MTHRAVIATAVIVCMVTIASSVITYRLSAAATVSRESVIATCKLTDGGRVGLLRLFNDLIDDADSHHVREQLLIDRTQFIGSVASDAMRPGSPTPNGVRRDCEAVY